MFKLPLVRVSATLLILVFLQACATNPVTGKSQLALSESWERSVGPKYHEQIMKEYTLYDDPEMQAYVNKIGQRLAAKSHRPDLPFTFTLLDSPQVNAFAIPGGYVYITRGIMAYMTKESHLAGVIGHEIGHVTARHGAQRAAQQQIAGVGTAAVAIATGSSELAQASNVLGGALMSGYGRTQELQSDSLGAEYIAKNNYSPDDMIGVIGILKNQELFNRERAQAEGRQVQGYHGLFSTHPKNDTRLQGVIKAADKFRDLSKPEPDNGEFLRLSNGMAFGDSESQGITRKNKFYHNAMDLFVEFPVGWRVQNSPSQLMAVSPANDQAIVMKIDTAAGQGTAAQYLSGKFQGLRDGRSVNTFEGDAYAAVASLQNQQTGQSTNFRVSAIKRKDQTFVIQGLGKSTLPNQDFFDVTKSVRRLKSNEKPLSKGQRIKLITAKRGDTIAKLAKRSNLSDYAEAQLRLINDLYPSGEPKVGQTIKIIE